MGSSRILPLLLFLFVFVTLALLASPWIQAEDNSSNSSEDIPAWVKRIEFSAQLETDKNPLFYFQTVQPFHQNPDKTDALFIQPRVHVRAGRTTSNLGIGYRRLASENWIWGANLFADYQDLHRHGRLGLGLEALGQIIEFRANSYFGGITNKKRIQDSASVNIYEEAVDGVDAELGFPLPYLPWLKLYGSGLWYDFKKFDDRTGWKSRLEAKVNEALRLEFYTWDDNKGEQEYGGRIRINMAFASFFDFKDVFRFSSEAFPQKDLKEDVLIPVERSFDVTVEKWQETGGLTVEAGRT